MKKVRSIFLALFMALGLLVPATASAESVIGDACDGNNSVICQQADPDKAQNKTNQFIKDIVSTLMFVLGAIAVIVIIVGGIRYATSNGDQNQLTSAKNTILYAVIGLVVAILAYAIVNFVLGVFL